MPKSGSSANFLRMSNRNINTKWLQSAMKSIGISTRNVIQKITPNIYDTVVSGAEIGRDFVTTARQNVSSIDKVANTIRGNRYVQYAEKAYKNALTDIKTGNLNNEGRAEEAMMNSFGFGSDGDGYSFGDDGGEGGNTYNVYQNSGTSEAVLKISDQMAKGQVAQVKMQKATMDAYIAVQSTMMHQMAKNHAEIINHLTNIHSELASINSFNSENMSKFIEGSLAYYEKMGRMSEADNNNSSNGKMTMADVMKSGGGINLRSYKDYVKQNMKAAFKKTDIGMSLGLLDNDMMLDQLVANPLGMVTEGLVGWIMPKMLVNTLQALETTFNNTMPKLLSRLGDMANTSGTDFLSGVKRFLGRSFGAVDDRQKNIKRADINRAATPFDGETKHAITEIITKELREQTSLLKVIAESKDKNALKKAREKEEFFNASTGKYVTRERMNLNIADDIQDSIVAAFNNTKFGENIYKILGDLKGPKSQSKKDVKAYEDTRDEYDRTIKELFVKLEREKRTINLPELLQVINGLGAHSTVKENLLDYVTKMYATDKNSIADINTGRYLAQAGRRSSVSNITDERNVNHLDASLFNDMSIDDALDTIMGYGQFATYKGKNKRRRSARKAYTNEAYDNISTEETTNTVVNASSPTSSPAQSVSDIWSNIIGGMHLGAHGSDHFANFASTAKNIGKGAVDTVKALFSGDLPGLINNAASYVEGVFKDISTKAKLFFFGTKNEETNKYEGGVLSDLYNKVKGFFNDTIDKVRDNFASIGTSIKDGIVAKLFGKVKDPETGEYKDDPSKKGPSVFEKIKDTFISGITGWSQAFFGDGDAKDSLEEGKNKAKQVLGFLKDNADAGATGAAVGAIGGISMGGFLGTVIGGPFVGAGIGAITGFLSRSKSFQQFLFGGEDEDGNEVKGLISKQTQQFFKDNKDHLIGSSAVGAVGGMLTGGGLLGTLVGGPVGGAIMGLAGGIITKSDVFQKFWLGDPEKGQKGFIQGIKDAWSSHFAGSGKETEALGEQGTQVLGMAGTGAVAGGIMGALMGGPIVGAIAGLSLGIASQGKNLKEFFLGKEDGLNLGDGTKTKRQGIFGVIGNYINANILGPLKTEFKFMVADGLNVLQHKILAPLGFAAEFVADKLGGWVSGVTSSVGGMLQNIGLSIVKEVKDLFAPITDAAGQLLSKGVHTVYTALSTAAKAPGAIIMATIKAFNLKEKFDNLLPVRLLKGFVKDVGNLIKTGITSGIKLLFKGLFNILKSPFLLLGKVADAAKFVGKKVGGAIGNVKIGDQTIGERFSNSKWAEHFREQMGENGLFGSLSERMRLSKADYEEKKKQIREEYEANKQHDANAKIIAKATKGQFSADSNEARKWLQLNDPRAFAKLKGDSRDMTIDQLANADVNKLTTDDKQVFFLKHISDAVAAIVANIKGESKAVNNTAQAANAMSALNAMNTDDLREKAKSMGIMFDESTTDDELRTRIGNAIEGANGREISTPTIGSQIGNDIARPVVNATRGVKKAFKGSHLLNELKRVKKYFTADKVTKFIMDKTYGKFDEDSKEARLWLKQHDPRAYLKLLEMTGTEDNVEADDVDEVQDAAIESGENVEQHFVGGLIKNGLSLVGEAGAELINVGKSGVEVLSNKATKAATRAVKRGRRTFSSFFNSKEEKEKDNSAEEASDEDREARMVNANTAVGAAKNSAEHAAAAADAAKILVEAREDIASDNQKKALDEAKTASEIRKEKEEEKAKLEEKKYREDMVKATKDNGGAIDNFKKGWDAIFSKKGLITAGALLIGGWLIKNFPGMMGALINGIAGIGSKIAEFVGGTVGDAVKDATWTQQNGARTNGNSVGQQAQYEIDEIKKGNVFTNSKGEASHHTEGRLKLGISAGRALLGNKTYTKGIGKGLNMVGGAIKNIGGKVGNALFGKETLTQVVKGNVDDAAEAALHAANGLADNSEIYETVVTGKNGIVTKAMNKAGGVADDIGKLIEKKAAAGDGLLSKVCKYIDDFFKFITEKFAKKTGQEATEKVFKYGPGAIIKALKSNWDNLAEKIAAKISAITGAHVTGAAVTAGLTEVAFASLNAINGVSGTAKLFQVPPDKVDGTMKIIAGVFGAATGTLLGSIIDVVFNLVGGIMGVDLLHSMAVGLYKVIVGSDSEKAKKLDAAQDDWHNAYIGERDEKLRQQYETQKKAGIIGPEVTYEMFEEGVKNGTYKASYDSFLDWNTKKNGSLMDKGATIVGKAVKGAGFKLGKFWNGETSYTDEKGNTYKKNQDGTYQVTGADGSDLGYVSAESVDTSKMTENKKEGFGAKVASKAAELAGNAKKFIGKHKGAIIGTLLGGPVGTAIGAGLDKLFNKEKDVFYDADGSFYDITGQHYTANGTKLDKIESTRLQYMINSGQLEKGTYTFEKSKFEEITGKAKEVLSGAWKDASKFLSDAWKGISDGIKNAGDFLSKHKAGVVGAVIGGPLGAVLLDKLFSKKKTCYYAADGSYYTGDGKHYSANGDLLEDSIEKDVLMAKITTGQLTKGTYEVEKSDGQKMIEGGKKALSDAWSKISPTLSGLWNGFKENVAGPLGNILKGGFNALKDEAVSKFKMLMNVCWIDSDGSYYVQAGEKYNHYTSTGDLMGEGVDRERVDTMIASGLLVKGEIPLAQRWGVKYSANMSILKEQWGKVTGLFGDVAKKLGEGTSAFFKKAIDKGLDRLGMIAGVLGMKTKKTAWYYNDGSYYVQFGNTFTYYNPLGDIIQENIPEDDVKKMISSGLLTQGEAQVKDNRISNAAKSIGDKAKGLMDKGINAAKDAWSKFTSWLSGGGKGGSGVGGYGKGISKNLPYGGFGEMVNGASYFSQNDPRWAGKAYNMGVDNATMGDAGCGPTAMAMAVNTAKARQEVTPMQMANMAKMTGNRDNTGTNSKFIGQAAAISGLSTSQMDNPSGYDISRGVATGNPVVLLGKGGSTYTNAGHYVVAVGHDSNGNILINDPRGKGYSKAVSPKQLNGNTISAWSVGNMDPYALKQMGQAKNTNIKWGGRGGITSSKIIAVAQAELGYMEKDNASNLDSKTGGGSRNFTKYARDVGHANGQPWCVTFVVWVFQQAAGGDKGLASNTLFGATTAGCAENASRFKKAGRWLAPSQTPKPGDVIFYKKSHTGVVVGVNGTTVYTIEGNTSGDNAIERNGGQVALKQRTVGDGGILGWGSTDVTVDANMTNPSSVSSDVSGLASSTPSSGATTMGGSMQPTSKFSQLSSLFSGLASEAGTRAIAGDFSNSDYSSVINPILNPTAGLPVAGESNTPAGSSEATGFPTAVSSGQKIPPTSADILHKTDIKKLPMLDQYSIEKIISTRLAGKDSVVKVSDAAAIKAAQDKYGISALALLGIATQESGLGTSNIAKKKYNLWGWGATNVNPTGNAKQWSSVGEAFDGYTFALNKTYYTKRNEKSILDISGLGGGAKIGYAFVDSAGKIPDKQWGPNISKAMSKYLDYGLTASSNTGGSGTGIRKGGYGNLSARDKNRVHRARSKAKSSMTGGFGASVSTSDLLSSTTNSSTNIGNYISTTPENSTEEILINALEILATIAVNTGSASSKLDMLNNLKNTSVNGGTNNIVLTGGNGNTAQNFNANTVATNGVTKNEMSARAIAKGGY
nr:MAG TPA: hypothetical protein [Caudoviricetes sp.]